MDRTSKYPLSHFLFILAFGGTIPACVSLKTSEPPSTYETEAFLLKDWSIKFASKDYVALTTETDQFLRTNPHSHHWFEIAFLNGRAREGFEDWSGAITMYRHIIERSFNKQMEFVALAHYRIGFCYEVLLENDKALAAFMDASRLKAYLPLEVYLAEIPARIASIHARLNQTALADSFAQKAELGLSKVKALRKNADPDWLGQTYLKMGSISLTQVDKDSFKQNIFTLERNQRYLLAAIELDDPRWSIEAQEKLLRTYNSLWRFIDSYKGTISDDWEADLVSEAEDRARFASQYLEAIEKLKTYRAPEESPSYSKTRSLYENLETLETKALSVLKQELLKKPWRALNDPTLEEKKTRMHPATHSSGFINVETEERPEYIPVQLPKKKTK